MSNPPTAIMIELNKPLHPMLLCNLALQMLKDCHAELRLGASDAHSYLETMMMVRKYDDPHVIEPVKIVMQFLSDDLRAKGDYWVATYPAGPMLISTAFCLRAKISFEEGHTELAWSNTAQAMFWCSVANTSKKIEEIVREAARDARAQGKAQADSEKGRSGAAKRSSSFEPLRDIARQHVQRQGAKWSSRNQAAQSVLKELEKYCQRQVEDGNAQMSAPTLETVHMWLKAMPDASTLFPSKRTARI